MIQVTLNKEIFYFTLTNNLFSISEFINLIFELVNFNILKMRVKN